MAPLCGFIVNVAQAMENGRSVIHAYCRGEHGVFVVHDTTYTPYFYTPGEGPLRAFDGTKVCAVHVARPSDVRARRDHFADRGVATFEADLRHTSRWCIDHDLKGALEVDRLVDPTITPITFTPTLRVLSIDIETTATADRVLSVALHGCGDDQVILLDDERALLQAFSAALMARDPDVITGWNVIDFDLAVLQRRARANNVNLRLGRDGSGVYIAEARSFWNASSAAITGRVVLDGIALVRNAFVPMEEHTLEFVAQKVLGEGKTLTGPQRVEDIQRLYKEDRAAFAEYNLKDAVLVTRIIDKLGLIDLAVERSLLTGMALDRVAGSIASFDSLYLPELHRRGYVAPTVSRGDGGGGEEQNLGGLVLEPTPGLFENVLVVDFKSLYPSIMRTFQIDPLGHAQAEASADDDAITAPNGARFARTPGILPQILDHLFTRREAAKQRGDAIASNAIKILMNSLYGVLGSPACRFHSGEIANAITGFGREILLWTKARIEATGRAVLYGDTDSLFVQNGTSELVTQLNEDLAAHIAKTWRVESKLELEYDTLYRRLFLSKMRQGEGGARKRYAGLTEDGEVVFTGMEVVRRDWTELAKTVQRELYDRLFHDRPVGEYLKEIVVQLKRGELDALLVYKKALRKPLDSYTASTPPHVAAARKLDAPLGRLISYVMTTQGPEPVEAVKHPLDRAHYIEKQLRPVAEPVLDVLGLDFATVAETTAQLRLF